MSASDGFRVVLGYPHCLERRRPEENVEAPPMGLYSIAAVLLEKGFEARVLNWYGLPRSIPGIRAVLAENRPSVLGLSILQANRFGGLEIARLAKELDPSVKVVFGGVGATFLWEHFLTHFPQVDFVVCGEGELTFLELVDRLESGRAGTWAEVPGLAYRERGRPRRNPDREPIADLDSLPIPAEWFTYSHVALTRGCPGDCTFCGSPRFWGRRVRFRSAGHFVRELELLKARGVRHLFVSDDTFTLDKKRVIKVCSLMIERGLDLSWQAISRVDRVDEEVLGWMRRAGCVQLSYGVESGSPSIRRTLNKRTSDAQIKRAFELTMSQGLLARAYFIYGSPGETEATIGRSVELILAIRPLVVLFHVLTAFPGTALYEDLKARLGFTDDIWLERVEDLMYFEVDPGIDQEFMTRSRQRLREAYARNLPAFARALCFAGDESMRPLYADFLSRLAMTLDRGELAGLDTGEDNAALAAEIYRRSLDIHPDPRAWMGLAMAMHRRREFKAAALFLDQALEAFPDHAGLILCRAVGLMNLGRFKAALKGLSALESDPEAWPLMAACHGALGHTRLEAEFRSRRKSGS
ncbi:MAG: radical SAM protein [Desulfovibrionaceae bacterium]|nr:radical SAM protein [Desulfovibrionaceae bacterium]